MRPDIRRRQTWLRELAEIPGSAARGVRQRVDVFDPVELRRKLPPFDLDALSVVDQSTMAYFTYYGIDFENRLPVEHHFGVHELAGYRIACHYFRQRDAIGTCVLVHGYFDHCGLYGHLIDYCLRAGFDVLAWDLPGHGLSSGEMASIGSFDEYVDVFDAVIDQLTPRLQSPLTLIGQSTGAAILMRRVFRRQAAGVAPDQADLVLLAPLVRPRGWPVGRVLFQLLRPFRKSIKRGFASNSSDTEFLQFVRREPLQSQYLPLAWLAAMRTWIGDFNKAPASELAPLVVQGDADHTVDWSYNIDRIRLKFPRARVKMVAGAGHHLVNETETLRAQIFDAMLLSNL